MLSPGWPPQFPSHWDSLFDDVIHYLKAKSWRVAVRAADKR